MHANWAHGHFIVPRQLHGAQLYALVLGVEDEGGKHCASDCQPTLAIYIPSPSISLYCHKVSLRASPLKDSVHFDLL